MFDVGWGEMFIIAVVALIVLGPERLPKAARFLGLWVRKARAQWYSVKSEFEREMASDELRRSLADPVAELRRDVEATGRDLGATVRGAESEIRDGVAPLAAAAGAATGAATVATATAPGIAATDDAATAPVDDSPAADDDRQSSLFADAPAVPGPDPRG